MCKCFQSLLETCYWHLIEKRFCYDESIALYEVPVEKRSEKNNNFFDNMAFYDSVAVIAGRAVVTIDPLPGRGGGGGGDRLPIVQQPTRSLRWQQQQQEDDDSLNNNNINIDKRFISKSVPIIYEESAEMMASDEQQQTNDTDDGSSRIYEDQNIKTNQQIITDNSDQQQRQLKSLRERRMSKSLYLKIDQPKELPLIRQQSMPKFYLDTPSTDDEHHRIITAATTVTSSMFRVPSVTLTSPVVPNNSSGFVYDLYSVVQMERARVQNCGNNNKVPVHSNYDNHNNNKTTSSRLMLIKEKIKLRRSKSTLGQYNINNNNNNNSILSHSHQHI